MRHHIRMAWAAGIVVAVALLIPAGALGSSGEITKAVAHADWTLGDLEGNAQWSGCDGQYVFRFGTPWLIPVNCSWTPYVTVGPGAEQSDCLAPDRKLGQLGSDVRMAWQGQGPGSTVSFSETDVPLSGESNQLACLSFAEYRWEGCPQGLVCTADYRPLETRFQTLDAALLEYSSSAHEEDLLEEAHEQELLEEAHEQELLEEAHEEELLEEAHEEALLEQAHEQALLEEAHEQELLQEAHEQELLEAPEPPDPPLSPAPPRTTGSITRAEASADWTSARIAGSVSWGGCQLGFPPLSWPCTALAYATVGPATAASSCREASRQMEGLDDRIVLVWKELAQSYPTGAAFDVFDISLSGDQDQLLCLFSIEAYPTACTDEEWEVCAQVETRRTEVLDSARLTAVDPKPSAELSLPPGAGSLGALKPPSSQPASRRVRGQCRKQKSSRPIRCARLAHRKALRRK